MKRNGFTLLELLAVLAMVAIIGVASISLFGRNVKDVSEDDLANKYKQIQQAAIIYVDLNESWLSSFTTNNEIYVRLGELQSTNYISPDLVNPKTGENFPSGYLVKIYKATAYSGEPFINSCIVAKNGADTICIANADGFSNDCCIEAPYSDVNW